MNRLVLSFLANVLIVLVCGCGEKRPAVVDVKGTVKFDGKPLADGMIMFVTPGIPGDTLDIKNGAFAGRARVGEDRRVEVYSYKEGPLFKNPMTGEMTKSNINVVAQKFNTETTLKATIKEGVENSFDFAVSSR